jgi:hypothetical protein
MGTVFSSYRSLHINAHFIQDTNLRLQEQMAMCLSFNYPRLQPYIAQKRNEARS